MFNALGGRGSSIYLLVSETDECLKIQFPRIRTSVHFEGRSAPEDLLLQLVVSPHRTALILQHQDDKSTPLVKNITTQLQSQQARKHALFPHPSFRIFKTKGSDDSA